MQLTKDNLRVNEAFRNVSLTSYLRMARILVNELLFRSSSREVILPLPQPFHLFSPALFLRSPNQSVAKRDLRISRVSSEFPHPANSMQEKGRERCPSSTPRATWNRNVIIIAELRIRMFFRSSNLLTYYTTRIDALGTIAWPQERFPYYANPSHSPCSDDRTSPHLATSLRPPQQEDRIVMFIRNSR